MEANGASRVPRGRQKGAPAWHRSCTWWVDMNSMDWSTLEGQALWMLGHADQAAPREGLQGMLQQLRIWQYLRTGMYTSWTVILSARDYKGKRAVVREVTWDRPMDWKSRSRTVASLKRRREVDPTVRIRDA